MKTVAAALWPGRSSFACGLLDFASFIRSPDTGKMRQGRLTADRDKRAKVAEASSAVMAPLRKRTRAGDLYVRPSSVETLLGVLAELPRDEIDRRAAITNWKDADYLPSECLLHLLRASRSENSDRYFERLFRVLNKRLRRALPQSYEGRPLSSLDERIRDLALDKFLELLCADRLDYQERLDFFEVRWDSAVAKLRSDARTKAFGQVKGHESVEDEETGELTHEVERAIGAFNPFDQAAMNEADYRSRLRGAIDRLPKEQIRIMEMIGKGIPIDSKDSGAVTIAKALGKSEKTIRTHRDKAYDSVRRAMNEGDA